MSDLVNPYATEQDRPASVGEDAIRVAGLIRMGLMILKVDLSEKQTEHLAYVLPAFFDRFPHLREFGK